MIRLEKIAAIFIALLCALPANAAGVHSCETSSSILAHAEDEVCDLLVEAAESCFAQLNKRFSVLDSRPSKTPAKDLLKEAEPIRQEYEDAIPTVKAYLDKMGKDSCGDQRERVKVMIEEMNTDLNSAAKHISRLKGK